MSTEDAITEKRLSLAPTNHSESLDPPSASTFEGGITTARESKEANGSGLKKLTENGHVDREVREGRETESREAEAEGALSTNPEPEPESTGDRGTGEISSDSFTESGDTEPTEGGPSWSEEDHEHKRVKVC